MQIAVIIDGVLSFADEPTAGGRDPVLPYLPDGYEAAGVMTSPLGGAFVFHCSADASHLPPNCTVEGLAGSGMICGPLVIVAVGTDGLDRSIAYHECSVFAMDQSEDPEGIPHLRFQPPDMTPPAIPGSAGR
jgi:hypothetical protein